MTDDRHGIGGNNPPEPIDMLESGAPMPLSIGRCADLYNDVRTLRLLMDKEVEKVKAREVEIREHIINSLSKSADTGAAGLRYRAQITSKRIPKLSDWGVFTSWVKKNDRFDMVQKRLGEKAVQDWVDDPANWIERPDPKTGEVKLGPRNIPGTEMMNVPDVSITKI